MYFTVRLLRNAIVLLVLFLGLHIAIFSSDTSTGFFESLPNTIFVFVFIGLFPMIGAFVVSGIAEFRLREREMSPFIGDAIFAGAFVVLAVATFLVYGSLGLLAA